MAIEAEGAPRKRAQDIARRIEKDINLGRLSPGAWLKQVDLEVAYGASRIEVRHALDYLASRRVVQHVPNRGYHVEAFDPHRVEEISFIRCLLEVAACQEIMARMDTAAIDELERRADRFADLVFTGDLLEQDEANQAFHQHMLGYCTNRELVTQVTDLRGRLPIAVMRLTYAAERLTRTAADHYEMVAALRERDLERLRRVTMLHILLYHRQNETGDLIENFPNWPGHRVRVDGDPSA